MGRYVAPYTRACCVPTRVNYIASSMKSRREKYSTCERASSIFVCIFLYFFFLSFWLISFFSLIFWINSSLCARTVHGDRRSSPPRVFSLSLESPRGNRTFSTLSLLSVFCLCPLCVKMFVRVRVCDSFVSLKEKYSKTVRAQSCRPRGRQAGRQYRQKFRQKCTYVPRTAAADRQRTKPANIDGLSLFPWSNCKSSILK